MSLEIDEDVLDKQDFNLFQALAAIDAKDYSYYDSLTPEQQKKFVPFMVMHWTSAVKNKTNIQAYYLQSTEYHANKYLFNENVSKHPKLIWLMLCAASPGLGKQFHQWIPHIREKVSKLNDNAKLKEIKDYFKKIYPKTADDDLFLMTEIYIDNHKKKMYIADKFKTLKYDEVELLANLVTDEDIENYEKDWGN